MRNSWLWRSLTFLPRKLVDGIDRLDFVSKGLSRTFPNSRVLNAAFRFDDFLYGLVFGSKAKERRIAKAQARRAEREERKAPREQSRETTRTQRANERVIEAEAEAEAEVAQAVPAPTQRTPGPRTAIGAERVRPEPTQAPARGQAPVREALGVPEQRLQARQPAGRSL